MAFVLAILHAFVYFDTRSRVVFCGHQRLCVPMALALGLCARYGPKMALVSRIVSHRWLPDLAIDFPRTWPSSQMGFPWNRANL